MERISNYLRDEYYSSPAKNLAYGYGITGFVVILIILIIMALVTSIPSYLNINGEIPLILSALGGGYLSYAIVSNLNLSNYIKIIEPGTKAILMQFEKPTNTIIAPGKYILLPGVHTVEIVEVLKSAIIYENLSSPAQDGPNIILPQFSTVFEFLAEANILNVNLKEIKDHILVLMAENIREIIGYNLNENLIIGENIQSKNRTSKYVHKFIDRMSHDERKTLIQAVNNSNYLSKIEEFFKNSTDNRKDSLLQLYKNRDGYMHLANKSLLEENPDVMKKSNYSEQLNEKYRLIQNKKGLSNGGKELNQSFEIELEDVYEILISMFRDRDINALEYFVDTPRDVIDIIGGVELMRLYKQFPIKFLSFSKGSFNLSKEVTDAKEAAVIADLQAQGKDKDAQKIIQRILASAEEIKQIHKTMSQSEALEEAQRIIMTSEGHETVNRVYSKGASDLLSGAVLSGLSKK